MKGFWVAVACFQWGNIKIDSQMKWARELEVLFQTQLVCAQFAWEQFAPSLEEEDLERSNNQFYVKTSVEQDEFRSCGIAHNLLVHA